MSTEKDKLNAEVNKLLIEQIKLQNESINLSKRNKYFEIGLILAIVAATVTVTKLFL